MPGSVHVRAYTPLSASTRGDRLIKGDLAVDPLTVNTKGGKDDVIKLTTNAVLSTLTENSEFFAMGIARPIPAFEPKEVEVGKEIGKGEFGVVHEVTSIRLDSQSVAKSPLIQQRKVFDGSRNTTVAIDKELDGDRIPTSVTFSEDTKLPDSGDTVGTTESMTNSITNGDVRYCCPDNVREIEYDLDVSDEEENELAKITTRHSMAGNTHRCGTARYALKRLKRDVDQSVRVDAAVDLACEALYLQSMHHSNIIRLRGTVGIPGTPGFAILLDRLIMTMDEQIASWLTSRQKYSGKLLGLMGRRQRELHNLITEQMIVSFDIARALRYLHTRKVLYRDIKPENLGFTVAGHVRLFDFGLAKELKAADLVEGPDLYDATGLTGTRRYMAPEVVRCKNYGFKADVYSFSILFWQIMALQTPYMNMDASEHFVKVVLKKKRPVKIRNVSAQIQAMMEEGWSDEPNRRPGIKQICQILEVVIADRDVSGKDAVLNRSQHLQDNSYRSRRRANRS